MEPTVQQFAFVSTSFAFILNVHCAIPLSVRHGFNSVRPLQAPPLGSYRYQFRSSYHHSSGGGFSDSSNETENPLNEIIMNLHKLESMFFGNNSFFHNFNFKHNKKNRTRLNFPKWFNSWPDFDDENNSAEGEENTTEDPCGNGSFFDFSNFDSIIMEIKKEVDDFFNDMSSIFPNFHKRKNSTDSSSEEDWFEDFFDDIKKSFGKNGKGHGKNGKDNENDLDMMKMKDNGDKMMMMNEGGDKMMMPEQPDTMTMTEEMTVMPEIGREVEELAKVTEHKEKPEEKKDHVEKIEEQSHPT